LALLFTYIAVFLLLGLTKGREYLKCYSSSSDVSTEYFFHHVNVTLALAGLAITALALFVGFGLENLERVSSITLFFSIAFAALGLSPVFRRFPRRIHTFIGHVLADVGILAIGCGFLVFFRHELPLYYGLTFTYGLFIVVFLVLTLYQLYKFCKIWSLVEEENEKTEDTSTNVSNSKKRFSTYEQIFLLFYGATIGLLVGVWGNLFATLFYEHIIKEDASLASVFLVVSLILIAMIAILTIMMIHFYKKMRRTETKSTNQ